MKQSKKIKIFVFFIVFLLLMVCYLILERPFKKRDNSSIQEIESAPQNDDAALSVLSPDTQNDQTKAVHAEQITEKYPEFFPVHIMGEVKHPGVYQVSEGMIIDELIRLAGGLSADADLFYVNLAEPLQANQKVYIPNFAERDELSGSFNADRLSASSSQDKGGQKININKAGKEELTQLTGIGPTKADAIIAYRELNGEFSSIEEIMQVSGIKENSFAKIKDEITVN